MAKRIVCEMFLISSLIFALCYFIISGTAYELCDRYTLLADSNRNTFFFVTGILCIIVCLILMYIMFRLFKRLTIIDNRRDE